MSQRLIIDQQNQSIKWWVLDANGDGITGRTDADFTNVEARRLLIGKPLTANPISITLAGTHANANDPHINNYIADIGGGAYTIDLPDSLTVSGADSLTFSLDSVQSGDTVVVEGQIPIVVTNAEISDQISTLQSFLTTIANILNGISSLAGWLRLLARSDSAATVDESVSLAEINADGGSGSGSYTNSVDSNEAISIAIADLPNTGTGANTVTITVNDGVSPIQNATVSLDLNGTKYIGTTDASGESVFNLDDASYVVAITEPGFTFGGATLIVSGNTSQTYSMTPVTIIPSPPGRSTGVINVVIDENSKPEPGVPIKMRCIAVASGSGVSADAAVRTETSDSLGAVQFDNLVQGSRYEVWRGDGVRVKFTVPVDQTSFVIAETLGVDS